MFDLIRVHEELPIERLLQELEASLFQPDARRADRLAEILSDEFVEFGSSGRVFTKAQVIAALQNDRPVRVTASLFNVQMFAPQAALVTYRALRHSDPAVYSLRSSVWEQKRGQWQMVFHQGTVVPDKL